MRRFILFIPGRRLTLSEFSSSGFVCVCVSVDADVLFLLVLAGVYVYFCVCVCVCYVENPRIWFYRRKFR